MYVWFYVINSGWAIFLFLGPVKLKVLCNFRPASLYTWLNENDKWTLSDLVRRTSSYVEEPILNIWINIVTSIKDLMTKPTTNVKMVLMFGSIRSRKNNFLILNLLLRIIDFVNLILEIITLVVDFTIKDYIMMWVRCLLLTQYSEEVLFVSCVIYACTHM